MTNSVVIMRLNEGIIESSDYIDGSATLNIKLSETGEDILKSMKGAGIKTAILHQFGELPKSKEIVPTDPSCNADRYIDMVLNTSGINRNIENAIKKIAMELNISLEEDRIFLVDTEEENVHVASSMGIMAFLVAKNDEASLRSIAAMVR